MSKTFERRTFFPFVANPFISRLAPAAVGRKDQYVETLRGMAIVLVVLGHMIGYTNTGGMRVSDDSIYRYVYYSLEFIRLPLFTVISGWVYASHPLAAGDESGFVKGKFRRLIIPMFVVSTCLFLFRMITPGTNAKPEVEDLPRNLIFPYDVYWYLYSLFLIFITITLLDRKPFFRRLPGWFLVLTGAFAILFISEKYLDAVPNIFSFKGAAYLFPFFLTGIGIFRYREILLSERMIFLMLALFAIAYLAQQLAWFGYFPLQEKHSLVGMAVGISCAVLLFRLKLKNTLLTRIGTHAYGIFLFHVFFTGGTRIILTAMGLQNQTIILILGVIGAIIFSIILESLILRSPSLRFYLLGLKKE